MDFQITGLPAPLFAPLFTLSDAELARRRIVRRTADRVPGFPCRVSLLDARVGETVLLLSFEHLPVAGPYRSRHAIFVREGAIQAHLAVNEVPEVLQSRLLSVRAFDAAGMMVGADVVQGGELAPAIACMLDIDAARFLHVHYAKPGCYAARVDRAA